MSKTGLYLKQDGRSRNDQRLEIIPLWGNLFSSNRDYCFFIDGTVEGTDIKTGNVDMNQAHDHSYYGNGCEVPIAQASGVACSSRIATTFDDENQKNGTSYNYQAATSGAGDAVTSDNAIISDTFCPLGWQLPYGGTGGDYYDQSKSLNYLFGLYNYVSGQSSSREIGKYPLSLPRTGIYSWSNGTVYELNRNTLAWTITNYANDRAYIINYFGTGFNITETSIKPIGRTLRCGFMVSILTYVENWLIFKT